MKKNSKRTFMVGLLFSLIMLLLATPQKAFAAESKYDVWVNGEQFTSSKKTITCGYGRATYDPDKDKLTLEDCTITKGMTYTFVDSNFSWDIGAYDEVKKRSVGIYCEYPNLTIELIGENTIKAEQPILLPEYKNNYTYKDERDHTNMVEGYTGGVLKICGAGSLKTDATNNKWYSIEANYVVIDEWTGDVSFSGTPIKAKRVQIGYTDFCGSFEEGTFLEFTTKYSSKVYGGPNANSMKEISLEKFYPCEENCKVIRAQKYIAFVYISGQVDPIIGTRVSNALNTLSVSYREDNSAKIRDAYWYDVTSLKANDRLVPMDPGLTFQEGHTYRLVVEAVEGNALLDENTKFWGKSGPNSRVIKENGKYVAIWTSTDMKAIAPSEYSVYVDGQQVTSKNCNSIPCTSGKASYSYSDKRLVLMDATISKSCAVKGYSGKEFSGIFSEEELNLVIMGDCTINLTTPSDINELRGIYARGACNISGEGTLTIQLSPGAYKASLMALQAGRLSLDQVEVRLVCKGSDASGLIAGHGATINGKVTVTLDSDGYGFYTEDELTFGKNGSYYGSGIGCSRVDVPSGFVTLGSSLIKASMDSLKTAAFSEKSIRADGKFCETVYIGEKPHVHVFNQKKVNEITLAYEATCEKPASYYYSCTCGEIGTQTFTDGKVLEHIGGKATCLKKAVCELCGKEYGELGAHTYGAEWVHDANKHWRICQVCLQESEHYDHIFGDDNVCDLCAYDKTVVHKHSGTCRTAILPGCTEEGRKEYYECSCGSLFYDKACTQKVENMADLVIPSNGHTESGWIIDRKAEEGKEGMRHKECTVCHKVLKSEAIPALETECKHEKTTVSGKLDANCTNAGYTGDTVCEKCGAVLEKGTVIEILGHDFGENGVCKRCGFSETVVTPEPTPTAEPTPTTEPTSAPTAVPTNVPTEAPTGTPSEPNEKEAKNSSLLWLVIVLAVLLVAAVAVILVMMMKNKKPQDGETKEQNNDEMK